MIYDISFLNYLTLHFTDRIKVIDRHRVLIEALYTRVNELYLLIIPLVINELRFSYFDDYYWSRRYQILTYFFSPQLQTIFFSFFFFFVHPTKNFSSFNKNTKPDVTILLSTTSFVSVSGTEDKNSDYVRFLISKFLLPVSTSRDFQYPFKPWNPRALFEFLNRKKIRERK